MRTKLEINESLNERVSSRSDKQKSPIIIKRDMSLIKELIRRTHEKRWREKRFSAITKHSHQMHNTQSAVHDIPTI